MRQNETVPLTGRTLFSGISRSVMDYQGSCFTANRLWLPWLQQPQAHIRNSLIIIESSE